MALIRPFGGGSSGGSSAGAQKRLKFIGRHNIIFPQGGGGTDFSATGRTRHVLAGPITVVQALFAQSGGELTGGALTPSIVRASIETSTSVTALTKNSSQDILVNSGVAGIGAWTDVIGAPSPAGSTIYARTYRRVSKAPTSGAATAIAGGQLAASTAYYFKLTTVDQGVESGASTEFSAATAASGNLALRVTWSAPAAGQYVNIYLGTAMGAEKFLAQVPVQQTSFVVDGGLTANTALSPPAGSQVTFERTQLTGESTNTPSAGGDGSDQTGVTGALSVAGPSGAFLPAPTVLLGDDLRNPAILWLGDSIGFGTGIYKYQVGIYGPQRGNMFDAAITDGQFAGTINAAIPSMRLDQLLSGAQRGAFRLAMLRYADYVLNELGSNDLYNGVTWQALAANHILLAAKVVALGGRYVVTTVTPRTTSTDGWLTATNQTVLNAGTFNAQRVLFNTWVSNGCQVDGTGAPVQSGGTASLLIFGQIDTAAAVEVNSSNALTPNGGLWLAPTAPVYTGQVLSGTPTTTSLAVSGASYPQTGASSPGLITKTVLITSGAAAGQVGVVSANNSTTLTLYAAGNTALTGYAMPGLSTAPAAGDTFSIYDAPTGDGIHPFQPTHAKLAVPVSAWLAANAKPFGTMVNG